MDIGVIKARLTEEGYRATLENSTVRFKFEGGDYYIDVDTTDPLYVRLGYPGFWVTQPEHYQKAIQSANTVTETLKAAKTYVSGDKVHCSIEQFMPDEKSFMYMLPRFLRLLQAASNEFVNRMKKP
ncbi:hypothetical protein GCM10027277_46750 [Pseudoduganella ginsengisoli]